MPRLVFAGALRRLVAGATRCLMLAALAFAACRRAAPDPALARLRALAASPDEDSARYALAARASEAGDAATVLRLLGDLDAAGWDYPPSDVDFQVVRALPRYRELQARARAREPRAHASVAGFTVAAADLFPEGIAYDARADAFLLGSMHHRKLVRVGRDGAVRELVAPGRDGLGRVLGVRVDEARGWVWAANNGDGASALHAFDLTSGALRRRVAIGRGHRLNDVAVDARGDAWVTDTDAGTVFRLAAAGDRLEPVLPAGSLPGANGIAAAGLRLYVASDDGLTLVDAAVTPPRATRLGHAPAVRLGGIDGLSYEAAPPGGNARLWALQNGLGEPRVIVFTLDAAGARVVAATTLETENAGFRYPTTGALAPDGYFYLACTSLDLVADGSGVVHRPETLQAPLVLRIPRDVRTDTSTPGPSP